MVSMNSKSYAKSGRFQAGRQALAAIAAIAALLLFPGPGHGGGTKDTVAGVSNDLHQQSNSQPTTLVIFADKPMEDRQWRALFAALRREAVEAAPEAPALDSHPLLLRGDAVKPGLQVESPVVVYLHGDCSLNSALRKPATGRPLGWALTQNGRIEPFAHVDCAEIGQVLGPRAFAMGREKREDVMASAVARIILHEWIHIATQCPAHSRHGISKAEFSSSDLTADNQDSAERTGNSR
jgi:hypothetical protein